MRINRYLAECGVCSRRKADELVSAGKVSVNKKVVDRPGYEVDENEDTVYVDGKKVVRVTHYDYVMFYKPKGCVTTLNDEKDNKSGRRPDGESKNPVPTDSKNSSKPRKTVMDYLKKDYADKRLFPVGRLDYDSEGLLILTNDGDLTYGLTHPSREIPKIYIVKIEGSIAESELATLRKGVSVDGVKYAKCKIKVLSEEEKFTRLEVTVIEGKNREIRKMFESVGKVVVLLKRIGVGELRLGGLPRGGYRALNDAEVEYLKSISSVGRGKRI